MIDEGVSPDDLMMAEVEHYRLMKRLQNHEEAGLEPRHNEHNLPSHEFQANPTKEAVLNTVTIAHNPPDGPIN